MGFLTTKAKVWYPAITDKMQLHTLFSTLASSIENGLEPRLALQEKATGLKASLVDGDHLFTSFNGVLPYKVYAGTNDFNNGFTLSGGIATVQTPGMYVVTASCGASVGTNTGLKITIFQNNGAFAIAEVPQSQAIWVNAAASCVVNCVAGDTIHAQGARTNGGSEQSFNRQPAANFMSIAMVQATPQ